MSQVPSKIGASGEEGRIRLDRERILDAAEAIACREGVASVTMRRIGAELGADPTAAYRHFSNKRELLLQLAERMFGTQPDVDPNASWRDRMRAHIRHSQQRYRVHLDLALLLAQQPDDTPSLCWIMEDCLGDLAEIGLGPEDAARMYQLIENHCVGTGIWYALLEQPGEPRFDDLAGLRRTLASLPPEKYPHLVAAAPHMFPDIDELFDVGTEAILDAIEALARKRREARDTHEEGTT